MRSSKTVHVISAHAEGEVGDVIVGGVLPPPGETIWAQSRWIAQDQTLRNFMLNEPRGGVFRHVNLLVPPKHPEADAAWIIMEPEHTPPMSGSNSICVATVLLDGGLIPMQEPVTHLTLEAPGGLVRVRAHCRDGKAERIFVQNVPSFVCDLSQSLEVEGLGTLTVDTAYGGDSFVVVQAEALGFFARPKRGARYCAAGREDHQRCQSAAVLQPSPKPGLAAFFVLLVCRAIDRGKRRVGDPCCCCHSAGQGGPLAHRYGAVCPHGAVTRKGKHAGRRSSDCDVADWIHLYRQDC